jgi:hypothetical protein
MADPKPTPLPPAAFFNMLRLSFNRREFFFDLGQASNEPGIANLLGRFVTTPEHTKQIAKVLKEMVDRYESQHGLIDSAPSETIG